MTYQPLTPRQKELLLRLARTGERIVYGLLPYTNSVFITTGDMKAANARTVRKLEELGYLDGVGEWLFPAIQPTGALTEAGKRAVARMRTGKRTKRMEALADGA